MPQSPKGRNGSDLQQQRPSCGVKFKTMAKKKTIKVKIKAKIHPLFKVGIIFMNFGAWIVKRFNIIVRGKVEK